MSTHKNIDRICVVITLLSLILTILFINGETLGIEVVRDTDAESYSGAEWFTANDLNGEWDNSNATYITLKDDTAKVTGGGAYVYKGSVVITQSGKYIISGILTDGNITVDAEDFSKVWIRLDGAEITCSDDACFIVEQADKVFLTLGSGTVNSMTSGSRYSEESRENNINGAIFARDDLTINGSGSLVITAPYKFGIDANDELVITGGTISVSSSSDGIHVNDSFRMTDADLIISSGDDAIHCDKDICIAGGSIYTDKCYEGLEALRIDITGGDITLYPSDDGLNANGGSGFGWGYVPSLEEDEDEEDQTTYIRISGGTLTIINRSGRDADGLDSNGDIYIDGGTVRIYMPGSDMNNAIDYGSESGYECIVTGGDLLATGGTMMAEPFSAQSTQCAVILLLDNEISADTTVTILDAGGNVILTDTPACSYSSVAFSSPALSVGKTYTVQLGNYTLDLNLQNMATKTKIYNTSDDVSEPYTAEESDGSGNSGSGGFPGGGGPPGGGGGGGFPGGGPGGGYNGQSGQQSSSSSARPVTTAEWILLVASFAALMAGLAVVILYRKKH